MDNTIPTLLPTHDDQWMDHEMPYYYQQPDFAIENNPHEFFSADSNTIITTNTQNRTIDHHHHHQYSISTSSPENSSQISDHHELISPKSNIMKPVIRRRSRASKITPTTLLNASITNFRALVQQHTGCHTSPMFKNQKGPINLSFGPPTDEQNDYIGSNSIGEGSKNYGYYYNNHEEKAEKYSSKDNLQQEEQESGTSAGYSNSGNSKLSVDDYGW